MSFADDLGNLLGKLVRGIFDQAVGQMERNAQDLNDAYSRVDDMSDSQLKKEFHNTSNSAIQRAVYGRELKDRIEERQSD